VLDFDERLLGRLVLRISTHSLLNLMRWPPASSVCGA
jgi:hypothetical protein